MNSVKIQNARLDYFKMSLCKENVFIGRALVKNVDGTFPLVCFDSVASKFASINPGEVLDVEGFSKDYSYTDYNDVQHFVKLVIVTAFSVNGVYKAAPMERKEYEEIWEKIKKAYMVLDIIEFERISSMEVELGCCQ